MEENDIQINCEITINVDVSVKSFMYVKNVIFGILLYVVVKMENILASVMDDSAIMCDKVVEPYDEETKTIPTNLNEKKAIWKRQNFYILLAFLLTNVALLIAVSI